MSWYVTALVAKAADLADVLDDRAAEAKAQQVSFGDAQHAVAAKVIDAQVEAIKALVAPAPNTAGGYFVVLSGHAEANGTFQSGPRIEVLTEEQYQYRYRAATEGGT